MNQAAISKASEKDSQLLLDIAKLSFNESHGHSAGTQDISDYINKNFTDDILKHELSDRKNIYHILYYASRAAGYSKIVFDNPFANSELKNIAKLERLYLLKEFYDLKLGSDLFQFNINLAKENSQAGIWLFVWKENRRAVKFYEKKGFEIIGSFDFKISETHANPNHQMFLRF